MLARSDFVLRRFHDNLSLTWTNAGQSEKIMFRNQLSFDSKCHRIDTAHLPPIHHKTLNSALSLSNVNPAGQRLVPSGGRATAGEGDRSVLGDDTEKSKLLKV